MNCKSIYKIPEGKLVKISLSFTNKIIDSITINGDFFVHPENGIELIEKNLIGKNLIKEELINIINSTINEHNITFFGITSKGIVDAIFLAIQNSNGEKIE